MRPSVILRQKIAVGFVEDQPGTVLSAEREKLVQQGGWINRTSRIVGRDHRDSLCAGGKRLLRPMPDQAGSHWRRRIVRGCAMPSIDKRRVVIEVEGLVSAIVSPAPAKAIAVDMKAWLQPAVMWMLAP